MAAKSPKAATAKPGSRAGLPWLQGLLCGIVAAVATPTAVLAGGLLAPAMVLFLLEAAADKPATRCVMLSGLAAATFPLMALWSGGHSMDLAGALLGDPANLLPAWIAQAAGWLAVELAPLAVAALESAQTQARTARLRQERTRLQDAWGIDPPQPPAAPP